MTAPTATKTLNQIAAVSPESRLVLNGGSGDALLSALVCDSRQVSSGALFVALVGERFNGHDFLANVVGAGASALLVQENQSEKWGNVSVPCLAVPNCRAALAPLSVAFYDNPTRDLFLAGVTGTNGKTTVVRMIDSIARANGDTTGTVGTLGATVAGQVLPGERTTPEAPDLQKLFRDMVSAGAQSAAMEVASHALAMGRTDGCLFNVGVFTNLTQDHLDFHGTMEAYRDAKAKLFTTYAEAAQAAGKTFTAVLNRDDDAGLHYWGVLPETAPALTYGVQTLKQTLPDIVPENIERGIASLVFTAQTPIGKIPVRLPFGGGFNVANALAAIGYGVARGLSVEVIAKGLANCPPVPGRFEPVQAGQDFAVLVDYAHTPDGLQNVLMSARPLTQGKLITVFGCGGNRDKTKRPLMGKIARDLSDIAIVTSDNPRREDPEAILDDVLAGMTGTKGAEVLREADRRAAIALAVRTAQAGDTIVIAGKGHEDYQIIGEQTFPFSDVDVAREEIGKNHA